MNSENLLKTRSAENYSDALSNASLWEDNSPDIPIKTPPGMNKPTPTKSTEPTVLFRYITFFAPLAI